MWVGLVVVLTGGWRSRDAVGNVAIVGHYVFLTLLFDRLLLGNVGIL